MRSKELIVFISFLFLIFLGLIIFIPRISAQTTCSSTDQIILRLSDTTNAHGEVYNGVGNYPEEICYDTIFGVAYDTISDPNFRTCDPVGGNRILKLSSTTNAHAEDPGQNNYATEVCYGDLVCNVRTGGCLTGESLVVSLSDTTNAHLSNDASYLVDICCIRSGPAPCSFDSSSWSVGTVQADNTVQLNVVTLNCNDGENVTLDIGEIDAGSTYAGKDDSDTAKINVPQLTGTISGNSLSVDWTAEWHLDENNFLGDDDPEYVFQATLDSDPGVVIDNSGTLKVTPLPCDLTSASWSRTNAIEGEIVELNVVGTNCDGKNVSFDVWEDDAFDELMDSNPPADVTFNGTTATGTWIAEWIDDGAFQGDPEYYFIASVAGNSINSGTSDAEELHVTEFDITTDCTNIVICSDYPTEGRCIPDLCGVADASVPESIDCNDPDIRCECSWNIDCNGIWVATNPGDPPEIGTCFYDEDTSDTCEDDGFLTFNWTATWTWDPLCDETCQAENQDIRNQCKDGSKTIICPAQIQLPFFGAYNFIIALVVISLIYWVLALRRKIY